jgi:hypothetical protein
MDSSYPQANGQTLSLIQAGQRPRALEFMQVGTPVVPSNARCQFMAHIPSVLGAGRE